MHISENGRSLETELINNILTEDRIYIYGAGFVGRLCFKRLVSNGIPKEKIFFLVSKKSDVNIILDRPVLYAVEADFRSGAVILGTDVDYQDEIRNVLEQNHCSLPIYAISNAMRHEMENNHMAARQLSDSGEDIDVLLMLSDNYSASGAFLCAKEVCDYMNRHGIKTVMILPEYGEGEDLLKRDETPYSYIPSINWCVDETSDISMLPDNNDAIREIEKIVRNRHVKLIHNNTAFTYVGELAAREMGIPCVWHLRECVGQQKKRFIDQSYASELIGVADVILCVSDYTKRYYSFLPKDKTRVVYDGVSRSEENGVYPERFTDNRIQILSVGVVEEHKGQEDLINAACRLKDSGIDFHIVFLGGLNKKYYEKMISVIEENDLSEYVEFAGLQQNVWAYYAKADIAVVSSRIESFGRCTAEALQAGCLTIGARAGATPEIIRDGENGYLYEPWDSKGLADIIINVSNNREKSREIIKRGIESGKRYTVSRNAESIRSIYLKIWNERGIG